MTLAEAIEKYRDHITFERRMAAGTVQNYIADLEDLRLFLLSLGVEQIDQLESKHIRRWQMQHIGLGEAPGTVKRRLSSVSGWLRFLRKYGFFDADLMAKVSAPRQPKHLPVFFKTAEVERIYDADIFPDTFVGKRDALILRLLYETGMRRSELAGLKESSLDLHTLSLKVLGKRNKERLIPIEQELAHNISTYLALKSQQTAPSDYLFVNSKGKPMTGDSIYYIVRKYMTSLSSADRISPHVFRHSFATHILDQGGNLQAIKELLGHEDLSTTEVYTHVSRQHLKEAYSNAHPRSRKKN